MVISPRCKEEYIGKTGIGDSKLRDRVTIYGQHIRHPQHEILKVPSILELAAKETSQRFYVIKFAEMDEKYNDSTVQWFAFSFFSTCGSSWYLIRC